MRHDTVIRHGEDGFAGMRKAGRLAASVLDMITPHVVAGVTTAALDKLCHDFILQHGAVPAPSIIRAFPNQHVFR